MKKLLTIALVSLLAGCSLLPAGGGVDSEQALKQHEAILNAITIYIGKLQELGVLPKPEEIKAQEEAAKGDVQ